MIIHSMKPVFSSPVARVYDDLLPPLEFEALWRFVQRDAYAFIHKESWNTTWRLNDGSPLQGSLVFSGNVTGTDDSQDPAYWGNVRRCEYPSRTALDYVMRFLLAEADAFADLVGARDRDWQGITAKTFLHPPGSGISWHTDTHGYSGAFAYYAHPTWNCQWGGELMVADESMRGATLGRECKKIGREGDQLVSKGVEEIQGHLDNTLESERLFQTGVGQYIFPKPNRMVILAGGIPRGGGAARRRRSLVIAPRSKTPAVAARILKRLGLSARAPPRGRPRRAQRTPELTPSGRRAQAGS